MENAGNIQSLTSRKTEARQLSSLLHQWITQKKKRKVNDYWDEDEIAEILAENTEQIQENTQKNQVLLDGCHLLFQERMSFFLVVEYLQGNNNHSYSFFCVTMKKIF